MLPMTTANAERESSLFRDYLLQYFACYGKNGIPNKWLEYIRAANFASMRVSVDHTSLNE